MQTNLWFYEMKQWTKNCSPYQFFYSDLVLHYSLSMKWEFSRVTLTDVIGASNNWYTVTDINQQISR